MTVQDFPAPTCATCHFSGFGGSSTTHDVGDRLTWFLFAPISDRRPAWQDNKVRMQSVCRECHNQNFLDQFYTAADAATEQVNAWVAESDQIVAPLQEAGIMTAEPFDMPIDFTYFELWHHWGRTAKFGVWMQGPDYTQWHGAYEVLADLAELRVMVEERMGEPETTAGAEAKRAARSRLFRTEPEGSSPRRSPWKQEDEPVSYLQMGLSARPHPGTPAHHPRPVDAADGGH